MGYIDPELGCNTDRRHTTKPVVARQFSPFWTSQMAKLQLWNGKQKKVTVKQPSSNLFQICCALSRLSPTTSTADNLECHSVKWPVQKLGCEYGLTIPPPYHTEIKPNVAIDLTEFLGKLPDSMKLIYEKTDPKKLINLMLPEGAVCDEARKVAAAFWLWLCITDDILEDMNDEEFVQGIDDMNASLAGTTNLAECDRHSQLSFITLLFRDLIYTTNMPNVDAAISQWQANLIDCVREITHAFQLERPLMKTGKNVKLEEWMKLRVVTISARFFMFLAKVSLDIPGGMSQLGNPLLPGYVKYNGKHDDGESDMICLEATLQCILGLQNDILGWEKDNHDNLYLNCVQILAAKASSNSDYGFALDTAIEVHNHLVISAVNRASALFGGDKRIASPKRTSTSQSRRESLVPSLTNSKVTSAIHTTDISPRASLRPTTPQPIEREVVEVDILNDRDSDLYSLKEVSFRFFRCTVKVSWSLSQRSSIVEGPTEIERTRQYVGILLNMANGMANWMINSKRYAVKNEP